MTVASSLFVLLDDIASILDDVAAMTKVATKKTAGVLGDDLALNANQVAGVEPTRELPVVFAVAKGSAVNKAILIPFALLLNLFLPNLVIPLLMFGGAYLCFEGVEKLLHKWLHGKKTVADEHQKLAAAVNNPAVDLVAVEKTKIQGAIRTDFILSAEIIVISLGIVKDSTFLVQLATLVAISLIMTFGVYGLVALIVKLDDGGLYLTRQTGESSSARFQRRVGRWILVAAPILMKLLSILGTAAMFLVGGGIVAHNIDWLHHQVVDWEHHLAEIGTIGPFLAAVFPSLIDFMVGIMVGILAVVIVEVAKFAYNKVTGSKTAHDHH
jgi:predicted DNA repair protein MutK